MTLFERLTENAKADEDLLRLSDRNGDIFDNPREVDFSFETSNLESAQDFVEFVNGKSYGAAQFTEHEPSRFGILVLITMPINQNIINSVSGFMLCLSRLFQIDYQGRGSVAQPKKSKQ